MTPSLFTRTWRCCFFSLLLIHTFTLSSFSESNLDHDALAYFHDQWQQLSPQSNSPIGVDVDYIEFLMGSSVSPFHRLVATDAFRSIDLMQTWVRLMCKQPQTPAIRLLQNAAHLAGRPIYPKKLSNPPDTITAQMVIKTLNSLRSLDDKRPNANLNNLKQALQQTTPAAKKWLYLVFTQAEKALPLLESTYQQTDYTQLVKASQAIGLTLQDHRLYLNTIEQFDYQAFYDAVSPILMALHYAIITNQQSQNVIVPHLPKPMIFETAHGSIILSGTSDDNHAYKYPPLLLLDFGGNDHYSGSYAQSSIDRPLSIVIDLGGQDHYQSSSTTIGCGSAIGGFSALLDLGSENDTFEGNQRCFGYSLAGCSFIYNQGGDDTYHIQSKGLGYGELGDALLVDSSGNDTYTNISYGLGSGRFGGIGMLIDTLGSDHYISEATPVQNPSAQLPDQNFSGSQGFGTGAYLLYSEGIPTPGGIGILLDCDGDDHYQSSVFANGAGYGQGIGLFYDKSGNDVYQTSWYALGAAAHQACGFAFDDEGDDRYTISHYMALGAATDLSLGIFSDNGGKDHYALTNAGLGYALTNSIAIFNDTSGNDTYQLTNKQGLGYAENRRLNSLRGVLPSGGFFYDALGDDSYNNVATKNGTQWQNPSAIEDDHLSIGAGMDNN